MKKSLFSVGFALLLLTVLILGACGGQSGPVHVVVDNAAELRPLAAPLPGPVSDGGSRAAGDTNFTNVVASGYMDTGTYVDAGSYVNAGTFGRFAAQTGITVTTNGYITPTGTYQPLTAAGNVETSKLSCGTAGNVVILVNQSNTTITITDTGALKLTGNIALGQYDSLTLLSDGTNCIQLSTANN